MSRAPLDLGTIFIGYDRNEREAWDVCARSLLRRSSIPLHVVKLGEDPLRHIRLYDRPVTRTGAQMIDQRDGRPFSTEFAFTRFFVPALSLYEGWALFCDCDFLFTADIAQLFALREDRFAAMCVQHAHVPPSDQVKMDGKSQGAYARKNWSSLVLWNCAHPKNRRLTPFEINHRSGAWLHSFGWLADDDIGPLPPKWNWLAGVTPPLGDNALPCGIHYTLGGPWFPNHRSEPYADLWVREASSLRAPGRPTLSEIERAL